MRLSSLEDTISPDNQLRFIDAFVEYVDLSKLNFVVKTLKTEGRPSFNSKVFLKIYLYGYLNGVRSGWDLEKNSISITVVAIGIAQIVVDSKANNGLIIEWVNCCPHHIIIWFLPCLPNSIHWLLATDKHCLNYYSMLLHKPLWIIAEWRII